MVNGFLLPACPWLNSLVNASNAQYAFLLIDILIRSSSFCFGLSFSCLGFIFFSSRLPLITSSFYLRYRVPV